MWYPPINRTQELDAELAKLAETPDDQLGEIDDFLVKRAACKTLIDSERRKNTQASSDVGARQLARF